MYKKLSILLLMGVSLISPFNPTSFASVKPSKAPSAIQQLEKISGGTLDVTWNTKTNTPALLTGELSRTTNHTPEWIAYGFLQKHRKLYGLQNPSRDMKVMEIERYPDRIMVHFQHLLFQTPVWGDTLIVEMGTDGVIRRVEGTIHPKLEKQLFNRPMQPAISSKEAVLTAKRNVQQEPINEPEVKKYYLPTRPGTPLIYVVRQQYRSPAKSTTTLIHSLTGRIIEQLSQ
jgi:Zn-dependent metalloprotease